MGFEEFDFNGNWEYKISFPQLAGFQERNGKYSSVSLSKLNMGTFTVEFEDDLSDNTDPYPEQLNTIQYIFENQVEIATNIVQRTLLELPQIVNDYSLENEDEYQNIDSEKVRLLVGFSTIYIKTISKENYAYFDIYGGCNWDEEHGLNILFHKDRIVYFGGIDGNSTFEAEKDGGVVKVINKHLKPRRYLPNNKYNLLKPSQKYSNETYEIDLISQNFSTEFINCVENGEIEINGKWISQDKTYLEAACWYKNNQIVEYLLKKKADIRFALHQCVGYGDNSEAMKLLLNHGADINYPAANGNTIIFEIVNSIESFYRTNDFYKEINRLDLITEANLNHLYELKQKVQYLINLGANPYIKNSYGHNCFDIMRNSNENSRNEVNIFLEKCQPLPST